MRKTLLVLTACFLVCLCASSLRADTVIPDPDMSIDNVSGGSTSVGFKFKFFSNATGGGILDFLNSTEVTWFDLLIITHPAVGTPPSPVGPTPTNYVCGGGAFGLCTVTFDMASDTLMFHYFDLLDSIPAGGHFTINLNTPLGASGGIGGWGDTHEFSAGAAGTTPDPLTVPEPGTFVLLLTGAGPLALWRRTRYAITSARLWRCG